jgi:hypothetical protein
MCSHILSPLLVLYDSLADETMRRANGEKGASELVRFPDGSNCTTFPRAKKNETLHLHAVHHISPLVRPTCSPTRYYNSCIRIIVNA